MGEDDRRGRRPKMHNSTNRANSLFSLSVRKTNHRNIDGRVILPDIKNKPMSGQRQKRRRKPRKSHEEKAQSFDRWLNTVLDKGTKNKLMSKFGAKFDPHRSALNRGGSLGSRQTQSGERSEATMRCECYAR